jgi:lantibiotic modifying enzyme
MYADENGFLHYKKPVNTDRNKIKLANGSFADPSNYRNEILSGYCAGYRWFVENADQVSNFLLDHVPDDFRVRFLARKTRHYASVVYMLNLPIVDDYDLWMEHILERFRRSGYFPESISEKLIAAEIEDMKNRDIPYFWMRAGENGAVIHQSGKVHHLNLKESLKSGAIGHLQMLRDGDIKEHILVINNFLNADISLPSA